MLPLLAKAKVLPYGKIAVLLLLLGFGATIYIYDTKLTNTREELVLVQEKLTACNISQQGLKSSLIAQNNAIVQYNTELTGAKARIAATLSLNKKLNKDLQVKNLQVEDVKLEKCEDTIDWMLQEAITDEDYTRTISGR